MAQPEITTYDEKARPVTTTEVDAGEDKGAVRDMTMEDRAAALKFANEADPGLQFGSARWIRFACGAFVVYLCGGDNGFDASVMASVNSMLQFKSYFNITSSQDTALIFGIYNLGQVVAFFPTIYLLDKIGRRWSMLIGNVILIVGALITTFATTGNLSMFIGGRFLTGIGCSFAANSAKTYMSEIAPPATRGRWCGLVQSFYYIGQILASGIAVPFGRSASNWAWKAPILIQAGPPAINAAVVMFLDETPRWLYAHGYTDKARTVLAKLHSRTNDINSPLIKLELAEIEDAISLDGADKRWWDFRAVFGTRSDRYRYLMAAQIAVVGQLCGNGLISYFLPTLLEQAGIKDTNEQRVLTFVNAVTSFIGACTGTGLSDFAGRRRIFLFSGCATAIGMALIGGLVSHAGNGNPMLGKAGIAFIYIFGVVYAIGITPLQSTYPVECFSFQNRAKGVALFGWTASAVNLINTFAMPIALANIQWKTYFIFFAADVGFVIWIWLYAVETKRLSLEDLDQVFESENPKRTSLRLTRSIKRGQQEEGV